MDLKVTSDGLKHVFYTLEGKAIETKFMPIPGIGAHDSIELVALYNFNQSLPALGNHKSIEGKIIYE